MISYFNSYSYKPKPHPVIKGSILKEIDTDRVYFFDGKIWRPLEEIREVLENEKRKFNR